MYTAGKGRPSSSFVRKRGVEQVIRRALVVRLVLLAAHLAATVWIAAFHRRQQVPDLLLVVSALPLAQASLLAAWGACGGWASYVRVTIVVLGVTALWAVECHVLTLGASDDRCAAHALMFAVQTMLIGGLLATLRVGKWVGRHPRRERAEPARRLQFGVRSVLGWVAAIALILGAWKLVLIRCSWPPQVVTGKLFLFGGTAGAFNALFSLIILGCVWWRRRRLQVLALGLLALGPVFAVASVQSAVLQTLFDTDGNVGTIEWLFLAGCQAVYLLITLVPLRLWGYNQREEAAHETSTRLEARRAGVPDSA